MCEVLRQERRVAKKRYPCDCVDNIIEYGVEEIASLPGITFADLRFLVLCKQGKKSYIEPGEEYIYQVGIFDGDFAAVRSRIDVSAGFRGGDR